MSARRLFLCKRSRDAALLLLRRSSAASKSSLLLPFAATRSKRPFLVDGTSVRSFQLLNKRAFSSSNFFKSQDVCFSSSATSKSSSLLPFAARRSKRPFLVDGPSVRSFQLLNKRAFSGSNLSKSQEPHVVEERLKRIREVTNCLLKMEAQFEESMLKLDGLVDNWTLNMFKNSIRRSSYLSFFDLSYFNQEDNKEDVKQVREAIAKILELYGDDSPFTRKIFILRSEFESLEKDYSKINDEICMKQTRETIDQLDEIIRRLANFNSDMSTSLSRLDKMHNCTKTTEGKKSKGTSFFKFW